MNQNIKMISLDIYDTAISRYTEHPHDIYDIVGKKFQIENFRSRRINAEIEANKKLHKQVNIKEIYAFLDVDEEAMKYEIYLEKLLSYPNLDIKKLYDNNDNICFTSDMYLDSQILAEILRSNGYDKENDIYVSNEFNTSKRLGGLFEKLDNTKSITHYGDRFIDDYLMAKAKHLHSKLVRIDNKYGNIFDNLRNSKNSKDIYDLGYSIVGPLYLAYYEWIYQKVSKSNVDVVYFLSRDGYYLNLINDKLQLINAQYLNVSRMVLSMSYLENITEFVNYTAIDAESCMQYLNKYNFNLSLTEKEVEDLNNIQANKNKNRLITILKANEDAFVSAQKQAKKQLLQYLSQHYKNETNIAIVDIGWNGNMQYFLEQAFEELNENVSVEGFYIGILNKKPRFKGQYNTFLFDINQSILSCLPYFNSIAILELFFQAPHGTVIAYKGSKPIYKDFTCDFEKLKIQTSAIAFIDKYVELSKVTDVNITSSNLLTDFKKMLVRPKANQLVIFNTIYHSSSLDDNQQIPLIVHKNDGLKSTKIVETFSFWLTGNFKKVLAINVMSLPTQGILFIILWCKKYGKN